MLYISQNFNPCFRLCVCVCLCTFKVPLKRFIAPTSQSWMSKICRDSESLGKSNWKKWSQIWKLLLIKGVKLLHKKVSFWGNFALLSRVFLVSMFLTLFNGLFAPISQSPMSNPFEFSESLGKINRKKWSQIWKLLLIKGVKLPRQKKKVFFLIFFFFPVRTSFYPHFPKSNVPTI